METLINKLITLTSFVKFANMSGNEEEVENEKKDEAERGVEKKIVYRPRGKTQEEKDRELWTIGRERAKQRAEAAKKTKPPEGKVFLLHLWHWHHMWQKIESRRYLDLLNQIKEDSVADLEKNNALIEKGWRFLYLYNLRDHFRIEDEILYPQLIDILKEKHPEVALNLVNYLEHHGEWRTTLKDLDIAVKRLIETKHLADVAAIESSLAEFFRSYFPSVETEEHTIINAVYENVSGDQQREINEKIKQLQKTLDSSKFSTLIIRDITENIEKERVNFETYYPYFMRKVTLAMWEKADPLYKEHNSIFGSFRIVSEPPE